MAAQPRLQPSLPLPPVQIDTAPSLCRASAPLLVGDDAGRSAASTSPRRRPCPSVDVAGSDGASQTSIQAAGPTRRTPIGAGTFGVWSAAHGGDASGRTALPASTRRHVKGHCRRRRRTPSTGAPPEPAASGLNTFQRRWRRQCWRRRCGVGSPLPLVATTVRGAGTTAARRQGSCSHRRRRELIQSIFMVSMFAQRRLALTKCDRGFWKRCSQHGIGYAP